MRLRDWDIETTDIYLVYSLHVRRTLPAMLDVMLKLRRIIYNNSDKLCSRMHAICRRWGLDPAAPAKVTRYIARPLHPGWRGYAQLSNC